MKRCKIHAFLDLSNDLVCNELAAHELLCTMNDSVTYSLNVFECRKYAILLVKECIQDSLNTHSVIRDRHFLYELFLSGSLMLKTSDFHSDSLYETLCKKVIDFFVLHIKKLIFQ